MGNLGLLIVLTSLLLCLYQTGIRLDASLCLWLNLLVRCRVPRGHVDMILRRSPGASMGYVHVFLRRSDGALWSNVYAFLRRRSRASWGYIDVILRWCSGLARSNIDLVLRDGRSQSNLYLVLRDWLCVLLKS
jgi:Holliday junction resolvase-like predicted endonuclease